MILCQERCVRAVEILTARGAIFSYHWLCYVGCILVWLYTQGFSLKDIGETNMAVEAASAAEAHPALRFFDLLSWQKCQRGQKPDHKWGGFYALAQKVCPSNVKWLREVTSQVVKEPAKAFSQLASECQQLHFRLVEAGVLTEGLSSGNP